MTRQSDHTPIPLESVLFGRRSADIPRRRRSDIEHLSPANRALLAPLTGGVTAPAPASDTQAWRSILRFLTATAIAALALAPVAGGASLTQTAKKEQLRRYYKANGVVRWIGAHAKVTEYHPDVRVKRRWLAAARFWVHVRDDAWRQLHPAPAVDNCLSELISRESGWNVQATNPSSGAYGLPQALPGSKMASAGPDWATNPVTQIRWMRGYVQMYGGSCGALAFQKAHGWY